MGDSPAAEEAVLAAEEAVRAKPAKHASAKLCFNARLKMIYSRCALMLAYFDYHLL